MTRQIRECLVLDGALYGIRELPLTRWIDTVGFPDSVDPMCRKIKTHFLNVSNWHWIWRYAMHRCNS